MGTSDKVCEHTWFTPHPNPVFQELIRCTREKGHKGMHLHVPSMARLFHDKPSS